MLIQFSEIKMHHYFLVEKGYWTGPPWTELKVSGSSHLYFSSKFCSYDMFDYLWKPRIGEI